MMLIMVPLCLFCSYHRRGMQRTGHNGGRAPAVGAPLLQSPPADARVAGAVPDAGLPEPHIRMGPGPPGPPQVHRHRRRPAQLDPGLLFLAHGLADGPQTSGRHHQGPHHQHERPGGRPGRHVAEKVSVSFLIRYYFRFVFTCLRVPRSCFPSPARPRPLRTEHESCPP